MTTQTKAYAVLIGVDDYSIYDATNKHNLLGCVNDVRAFWDVCVTSGFAPENIHVLSNPPIDPAELGGLAQNFQTATRSNILAQRSALVARLRADERAIGLLVYSGHGAWIDDASESSAVICPSDFWMDMGRPNNEIPVQTLWNGAGSNLTVVLDCCHSGARSRKASYPITPRDPHRKHLPTGRAQAHLEGPPKATSDLPAVHQGTSSASKKAPLPTDQAAKVFSPLDAKQLATMGLLPIGSALPLALTSRALTAVDLAYSPYRRVERATRGPRILAACDVQHAAYQAEFAGRFHGAFTWAVTSTVGQWRVEEAADGAIRATIGCGAVQRHAQSLLQVFKFQQTPMLHPASAENLPFFGVPGLISEDPTGEIYTMQVDPEIKILRLALSNEVSPSPLLSRIEVETGIEHWTLGGDFVSLLSRATAASSTKLSFQVTSLAPTPTPPITAFNMPTRVDWGTAVASPSAPGFYSMSGAGPAGLALFFHLDTSTSPATVVSIDWYQGVVGTTPDNYPLLSPGRDFSFADRMPAAPSGLTWFHALVVPL